MKILKKINSSEIREQDLVNDLVFVSYDGMEEDNVRYKDSMFGYYGYNEEEGLKVVADIAVRNSETESFKGGNKVFCYACLPYREVGLLCDLEGEDLRELLQYDLEFREEVRKLK